MATIFGAIADDFTGATDLAGLLARSGARVSLRIGVPKGPVTNPAPFEVIALKIRTAPVEEAVAQALAALAWLRSAGAERFFWKYCSTFDSTAKGNIGPVAEALMARLGTKQTIYCPAFPENGRSVYMGNLYVGQLPLAESPMRDHPLTPMRDSNLCRLLAPQVRAEVGLVDRRIVARGPKALRGALDDMAAKDVAHVIVDAVAPEDLGVIASACADMKLMTGGSAVAMPLPDIYRAAGLLGDGDDVARWKAPAGAAIVLSGSCSAMTQAQVAAYAQTAPSYRLDPLSLIRDGIVPVLAWLTEQIGLAEQTGTPLIYATATPAEVCAAQEALGRDRAGAVVEEALAAIARAAHKVGVQRFVVAGGETSGAVTQALGVERLTIGPEIAPGVPWCLGESGDVQIALALKSGNFGDAAFFATALEKLDTL